MGWLRPAQRERGMRGCIVDSCCCSLVQRATSTSDNRRRSNAVPEPDSLTALKQTHESFCPLTPRPSTRVFFSANVSFGACVVSRWFSRFDQQRVTCFSLRPCARYLQECRRTIGEGLATLGNRKYEEGDKIPKPIAWLSEIEFPGH